MTGEGRCGQINGFSGEQRVLAPPAIGLLSQFAGWNAIDGLAVWADDMKSVTHEGLPGIQRKQWLRQLDHYDMGIRAVALASVAGCCIHPAFPVRAVRARTAPVLLG